MHENLVPPSPVCLTIGKSDTTHSLDRIKANPTWTHHTMCTNYKAERHIGPIHAPSLQLCHMSGKAEWPRSASGVVGHLPQTEDLWMGFPLTFYTGNFSTTVKNSSKEKEWGFQIEFPKPVCWVHWIPYWKHRCPTAQIMLIQAGLRNTILVEFFIRQFGFWHRPLATYTRLLFPLKSLFSNVYKASKALHGISMN